LTFDSKDRGFQASWPITKNEAHGPALVFAVFTRRRIDFNS